MRREKKNSRSKVKVLTAATLATLLAAGTLNVYAAGEERIAVEIGGTMQYVAVDALVANAWFRNMIIGAFNDNDSVLHAAAGAEVWREISQDLAPGDLAAGVAITPQPAVLPYSE